MRLWDSKAVWKLGGVEKLRQCAVQCASKQVIKLGQADSEELGQWDRGKCSTKAVGYRTIFFSFILLFKFYILYSLQRSLLQYILLRHAVTTLLRHRFILQCMLLRHDRNYSSSFKKKEPLNAILFSTTEHIIA